VREVLCQVELIEAGRHDLHKMMTVSNDQFRAYLETFHATYRRKIDQYIPAEYRPHLLRVKHLLGSSIAGYVSTIYGAGYEYRPGKPGEIEVSSGSARVDEFLFQAPRGALEDKANVAFSLRASNFRMLNARFGRIPLRLDADEAYALVANVRWTFRETQRSIAFAQIFADRTRTFWSPEKAVERAMDEVLEARLYVSSMERLRLSLGEYLDRFKRGHVLILGDFSEPGMARIERIRAVLSERGYDGITLKDVEEVREFDLRQKLSAVALACRFVVVDDSSQAGHVAELPIIEMLRTVTIVARLRGSRSTYVTRAMDTTSRVVKEVEYDDEALPEVVGGAVRWAESTIGEVTDRYAKEYPWRRPDNSKRAG